MKPLLQQSITTNASNTLPMQTDKIQEMTPEKRIKEEIRNVCARMEADLRGYRVVLFGSRTAGGARDRSDFDVGVVGDTPCRWRPSIKWKTF